MLGVWCLVEVLLPDYQTCNFLDPSGGQLSSWSDSVIGETQEARRATPAQIHDRSRLVIARAAVVRLLPTNWILGDHSSCTAGVEWGSNILVRIVMAWPPSCQIAHAMPQLSAHVGMALRNLLYW